VLGDSEGERGDQTHNREDVISADPLVIAIDPVSLAVVAVAAFLAVITFVDLARQRRTPIEVPLLFAVSAVGLYLLNQPHSPTFFRLGGILFVTKPYLLVRIVRVFRTVPERVQRLALGAMLVSWLAIVAFAPGVEQPKPEQQVAFAFVLVYLIGAEAYVAVAFVRGALAMHGVTHWRLVLASAGSLLFACAALIAGARVILEGTTTPGLPWLLVLWPAASLSSLSYYLSFSPPGWLRRAWQFTELYRFLDSWHGGSIGERAGEALETLCDGASRLVGATLAVVALQDEATGRITLPTAELRGLSNGLDLRDDSVIGIAWRERRALVARSRPEMGPAWRLAGFLHAKAFFAVPIATDEHVFGLLLAFVLDEPLFPEDDSSLLQIVADQGAIALANARLLSAEREVAKALKAANAELAVLNDAKSKSLATLDEELRIAHDIQVALLPKQTPELPGWSIAALYQPARKVGGDFYDVFELADGQFGLVVGDVTDKGMAAALVMATTQSIVRATARQFAMPSEVLAHVNDVLCRDIPPKMFVTCLYAVLDPTNGALRFANAGHHLPFKVTEGRAEQLRARGFPLGLFPGVSYEQSQATIEPGAGLLLYTDGLIEAHDVTSQMFGTERVGRTAAGETLGCSALIERLLTELGTFTGPKWEQEDDITLLSLRRHVGTALGHVAPVVG
jgi:serine phosphatase RsbU (regulator of sigma subunit)